MSWSQSANQSTAGMGREKAHVCNCIGCCPECGTCVTNPRHTAAMCKKLVAWQAQNPLLGAEPSA